MQGLHCHFSSSYLLNQWCCFRYWIKLLFLSISKQLFSICLDQWCQQWNFSISFEFSTLVSRGWLAPKMISFRSQCPGILKSFTLFRLPPLLKLLQTLLVPWQCVWLPFTLTSKSRHYSLHYLDFDNTFIPAGWFGTSFNTSNHKWIPNKNLPFIIANFSNHHQPSIIIQQPSWCLL